ncbi:MAG TPA: hypothetical protein VIP28_15360 [Nocardioides sp.]
MTDPQKKPEVRDALVRLVTNDFDPSGLDDDTLVAAHAEAKDTKKRTEAVVAAELYRRWRSWRRIGKALGVDHTTARGWVLDAGLMPAAEVDES